MQLEIHGRALEIGEPNGACTWRVETFFTKEPDTLAWIDSMKPGEVLLDVGANIGLYSMYAATKGVKVYAFEPHAQTYGELVQNIQQNKLDIEAYCAALTDEFSWSRLFVSGSKPAGSMHNFGEELSFRKKPKTFKANQGSFGTRIDLLPWAFDHIKIDVDGAEDKVVSGSLGKLGSVKSMLVEINHTLEEHKKIVHVLTALGFRASEWWDNQDIGNVIFDRR